MLFTLALILLALAALGVLVHMPARAAGIDELSRRIDALLPQTQCGQCGYSGCSPYAHAIAAGDADFNLCAPGGQATLRRLTQLLGREPKPLAKPRTSIATLARIDEANCIGCTLCIQACPVDAIVGAAKQMHTVIAAQCTGCELCLPPCPVECIEMTPAQDNSWRWHAPVAVAG